MYIRRLQGACTFVTTARHNFSLNTCYSIRGKPCLQREISKRYISLTNFSLKKEEILDIGGVSKILTESQNFELIPLKYGKALYYLGCLS